MPEPWTTERPKVLVVADDQEAGELLARLLERAGWTTDLAYSAVSGMSELDDARPPYSALVLDLTDTGHSLEMLRTVAATPALAEVRVVVCARDGADAAEAWVTGADAFLERPFEADQLVATVRGAVDRSPEERDAHRRGQVGRSIPDSPDAAR